MIRQKPAVHLNLAGDGHCTGVNGASVQPSEGQQHGMKTTVQAEQMKVCMLKSLLLGTDRVKQRVRKYSHPNGCVSLMYLRHLT